MIGYIVISENTLKTFFQGGKLTFFFTSLLNLRPCMCCIVEAMELFTNLIENIVFMEHQFMFYVQKSYAVERCNCQNPEFKMN